MIITKNFAIAFAIGLALVAIVMSIVLYENRGARVGLTGSFLKVRTVPLDERSSVAVIDFRFRNPGDYKFVVRTVKVLFEDAAGNQVMGQTVSETDAKALFAGIPLLGPKFNNTLVMRDSIASHEAADRMVAARFEVPESQLDTRKRLLVHIEDVDGPITEFSEK